MPARYVSLLPLCLWWHPPSCLLTGLRLPCAAQVAFIHALLYFFLAEARWALTSRACECTLSCNPIGRVHCACYRLGPVYSAGLCFQSRRLIRRDMVQRAVLWDSPVLLHFTLDIALVPCCWFGGCTEQTWVTTAPCTVTVFVQGVWVQSGILVCWADNTGVKGYNIFRFVFSPPHSHPSPALLYWFQCQGFKKLLQVMVSYTVKVGKNCLLRKDLREKKKSENAISMEEWVKRPAEREWVSLLQTGRDNVTLGISYQIEIMKGRACKDRGMTCTVYTH